MKRNRQDRLNIDIPAGVIHVPPRQRSESRHRRPNQTRIVAPLVPQEHADDEGQWGGSEHYDNDFVEGSVPLVPDQQADQQGDEAISSAQGRTTQQTQQTQQQRRENEEVNYRLFRERALAVLRLLEFLNATEARHAHSLNCRVAFISKQATAAAWCETCGTAAKECSGSPRSVPVVFIAQHFRANVDVPVFKCDRCSSEFHVLPELVGAFGGTPDVASDLLKYSSTIRTWFDIDLLESNSVLRKVNPTLSVEAMTETLLRLHRRQPQQAGVDLKKDTLRKQLGKTLEEYENVQFTFLRQLEAEIEDKSLLGCCFACSRDVIAGVLLSCHVYVDGNFRLPHLKTSGTATTHEPPLSHRIASDEAVEAFCKDPHSELPPEEANQCNDFSADQMLGSDSGKYDIRGVFGAFCRHGFLIHALNMGKSERWSYATFTLCALIKDHNIVPSHWWYDINCRYKSHFQNWLKNTSRLSENLKQAAGSIQWPLPTWHHSMHNAACQEKNSFRIMPGAGRGAGEPPEEAWAYFGRLGPLLQYSSLPSRQAMLERAIAYWNEQKLEGLPNLLGRMYVRAAKGAKEAAEEYSSIKDEAVSKGADSDELEEAVRRRLDHGCDQPEGISAAVPCLSWKVKYVESLLKLAAMDREEGAPGRVSYSLLKATSTESKRLYIVTATVKVKDELACIEKEHKITTRWVEGQPHFETAFQALCAAKQSALQPIIAYNVQRLRLIEALFEKVSTRRKDTRRVRDVKAKQGNKVDGLVKLWYEWGRVMDQRHDQPRPEPVPEPPADLLKQIKLGHYQWQADRTEGLMEAALPLLHLKASIRRRCEEEMELVARERAAGIATTDRQLKRIKDLRQGLDAGDQAWNASSRIFENYNPRSQVLAKVRMLESKEQQIKDVRARLLSLELNQEEAEAELGDVGSDEAGNGEGSVQPEPEAVTDPS